MYGVSPPENPQVKEIRAIVLVPQIGSYQNVTLPHQCPEHPYLKDMEPLGWIHTAPAETHKLSPYSAVMHSKLLIDNANWDTEAAVIATCSFTTGSCSLSVYKLTNQGFEWGKQHQDT
jgi:pre-mRNA-processing factor 8